MKKIEKGKEKQRIGYSAGTGQKQNFASGLVGLSHAQDLAVGWLLVAALRRRDGCVELNRGTARKVTCALTAESRWQTADNREQIADSRQQTADSR